MENQKRMQTSIKNAEKILTSQLKKFKGGRSIAGSSLSDGDCQQCKPGCQICSPGNA